MLENVRADIRRLTRRETSALTRLGILFLHPGLHAVLLYRTARWLHLHHAQPLAVLLGYISSVLTGAQISARATIGKGLAVYHPHGVVVGATAVVGVNCTLVHGNVIGQLYGGDDRPVIGDEFFAASGAKIFGRIRIGDRVHVGPNAVVTRPLPSGVTVAGNPARIVHHRARPLAGQAAPRSEYAPAASADSVLRRVAQLVASQAENGAPGTAIGEDTVLLGEGTGLDSIEVLHLISALEEEFDLTIDESELETSNLQTVGSLAVFVQERIAR